MIKRDCFFLDNFFSKCMIVDNVIVLARESMVFFNI